MIVGSSQAIPFSPESFDAVDIENNRSSQNPRDPGEDAVGRITDQNYVEPAEEGMNNGEKRMDHGIRVFPGERRKHHQPNAPMRVRVPGT